jgi:hypothetical protein
VFGLVTVRFIKAYANWQLEKGATVGSIQHLLGSRSLVSSVITPIKLRLFSLIVPFIILVWILNPIGGQLSLRVASFQSNYTIIDTPFVFFDPGPAKSTFPEVVSRNFLQDAADAAFTSALFSPASSKNGSQDIFGNLQIPMLEDLRTRQTPDLEGWFYADGTNFTQLDYVFSALNVSQNVQSAFADATGKRRNTSQPIYTSMFGIPFIRNASQSISPTKSFQSSSKLDRVKVDLFGSEIINTMAQFTMETSYLYLDCSLDQSTVQNPGIAGNIPTPAIRNPAWFNSSDVVQNGQGFAIEYDGSHSNVSTVPRHIRFASWVYIDLDDGGINVDNPYNTLTEARCDLTTTYVEVQVWCPSERNCTAISLRESRQPHVDSNLSVLDGWLGDPSENYYDDGNGTTFDAQVARRVFETFVNSTGTVEHGTEFLTPVESFFGDPVKPFQYAFSYPKPIFEVGDRLFSQRFTQLLNTYWLASIDPYELTNGIDLLDGGSAGRSQGQGQTYLEKSLLKCNLAFMIPLLLISLAMCAAGVVTTYMDATRRGPDVLDDFVSCAVATYRLIFPLTSRRSTRFDTALMSMWTKAHPWKTAEIRPSAYAIP